MSDSVEFQFLQSSAVFNPELGANRQNADSITALITYLLSDTSYNVERIAIVGATSPEGPAEYNRNLSKQRAASTIAYLRRYVELPDSIFAFDFKGRDWQGLRACVEADASVPSRTEVLELIDDIIARGNTTSTGSDRLLLLKNISSGEPYRYLYTRHFPSLRRTQLVVEYSVPPMMPKPLAIDSRHCAPDLAAHLLAEAPLDAISPLRIVATPEKKPFYMAVKTNMLFDVLAVPNIAAEFYLGKNLSLGADWMYGWWRKESAHRYWRMYGGGLALRYWFGHGKPLTGHHVGLYGGIFTYDFEWGHKGYLGGLPGHTLWDRFWVNTGIEYGYALPIARRLNLDFTFGLGYLGGKEECYDPQDGKYMWQSTRSKTWFGPAKAEVSLVWLIGRGNINAGKGGKR